MNRLGSLVFLTIWLVGLFTGGLSVHSTAPNDSSPLSDTERVRFTMGDDQIVLRIKTPWQSEWRFAASLPKIFALKWEEKPPATPTSPSSSSQRPVGSLLTCPSLPPS